MGGYLRPVNSSELHLRSRSPVHFFDKIDRASRSERHCTRANGMIQLLAICGRADVKYSQLGATFWGTERRDESYVLVSLGLE